jgi:hypothetical protein
MQALLIKAGVNDPFEIVQPADGKVFELEELQGFVDGNIEIVPTHDNGYLVINEEGKAVEDVLLENPIATGLYLNRDHDYIVGNALYVRAEDRTMIGYDD